MSDATVQKRKYPRYPTSLGVTVYLGAETVEGRIVNISRGGCLIFPPLLPTDNPQVRLSFRLREDLPPVNCKGEIIYTIDNRGTGVAFTEISSYSKDLLTDHFEALVAAGKCQRM